MAVYIELRHIVSEIVLHLVAGHCTDALGYETVNLLASLHVKEIRKSYNTW